MKFFFIILIPFIIIFNLNGESDNLFKKLNLTDEQIKIASGIIDNYSKKIDVLKIQLQIKNLELKQSLSADEINNDSVKNILKSIGEIETEIRYVIFEQDMELLTILDKEQQKIYKTLRVKNGKFSNYPGNNKRERIKNTQ